MRENCRVSAASIKTASGTDFGMSAVTAARAVAAVFLTVMFGIFLIIVFPLTESESPFGKTAPVRVARHQRTESYTDAEVLFVPGLSDLPAISDIYIEYDLKVIHNLSAGQMKSLQGGAWKIVWLTAALFTLYCYRVFFQKVRFYRFWLPRFFCELLILLKKDGKKRCVYYWREKIVR